jgi:hypothetical protein
MLVNPAGGTAVALMHNPNNQLEFVAVSNTNKRFRLDMSPCGQPN